MLNKGKIKKINEEIAKFNADQSLPENRIPVNIEEKIRKFGIELDKYCVDLEDEILGEIKKENGKYKINIQAMDHYYRKRFTMGHELGHFVLHKELIGDGVDDGKVGEKMYRTVYKNNGKISPIQEVDANRFSAELLIPEALAKFVVSGFPEIMIKDEDDGSFDYDNDFLEFLSNKFEVSKAVIGFRLRKFIKH